MNILSPIKYFQKVSKLDTPFKYLMSRFLVRTQLCRLLKIKTNNYKLHFFPTAISSDLWQHPNNRVYDIAHEIKPESVIIDIGANIGTTVIQSAIAAKSSGQILAFEANPKIFNFLSSNIKLNNLKNGKLFNVALGNNEGFIKITDQENDDMNYITDSNNGIEVKLTMLDSYTKELDHIDLLKIDVEGYELFVLEGAKETLQKTETIYIELSETHFKQYNYDCKKLLSLLEKNNFQCFRLNNGTYSEIITKDYKQSIEYENIIARK